MKILGKNDNDGTFIAELSMAEIANLVGLYSKYDNGFCRIQPGVTMDVSELYRDKREMDTIKNELEKYRKFFVSMADVMNKFQIKITDTKGEIE